MTLLLSAAPILFIGALVMAGIAALFMSMPPRFQPPITPWFVNVTYFYMRYGPQPHNLSNVALIVFSSTAVLLTCIPLRDALCCSGLKHLAAILLGPLAFFALANILRAGLFFSEFGTLNWAEIEHYGWYFRPDLLTDAVRNHAGVLHMIGSNFLPFWIELGKWCVLFAIAVRLTIAQVAAWRHSTQSL